MNYPKDFDRAEQRVQKIIMVRSDYSDLAEQLFDVLENEPENNEKQLKIIAELEQMEKNPSPATQRFIKQAKSAAQFTYFRAQFNNIIKQGSQENAENQYAKAIQTFYSGMYLYQENFFESNYDKKYITSVQNDLASLKTQTDLAAAAINSLVARQALLQAALQERNIRKSQTELVLFKQEFEKYATLRNTIAQIGWRFINNYNELKQIDSELTDASFLPFAFRLILGVEDIENSGIIASLDKQWDNLIPPLKPIIQANINTLLDSALSEFDSSTFLTYGNQFTLTKEAQLMTQQSISIATEINNLYGLKQLSETTFDTEHDAQYALEMQNANSLLTFITEQIEIITKVAAENRTIQNYKISDALASLEKNDMSYSTFINSESQKLLSFKQENNTLNTSNTQVSSTSTYWSSLFSDFSTICQNTNTGIDSILFNNWVSLANNFDTGCSLTLDKYQKSYDEANRLLNMSQIANEQGEILAYPTESIPVIEKQFSSYQSDLAKFQTRQNVLEESPENEVQNNANKENYLSHITNIQQYITKLNELSSQSTQLVSQARQQIILAQRAKNEADLRYKQAQTSLSKNDFDSARENLQRARTKYNESLTYQDSNSLKTSSDKNLETLGLDINRQENELIVKEVRQLKTAAKDAYYIGNFERAENLLTQAQTRWAVTNIEPDDEITNLLSLVNTALSMKTGRVIPPTAPLYPEMSQILSIANQYYDQGATLIANNKRKEAVALLETAKQKLRELQLVYPINQEASLLTLRIDKLIDEKSFNEMFEEKFNAAKNDYLIPDKQQTAYIDLLDLSEINPNYPGLKDYIYKVEIALGIRIPPPDPKALARSRTLTQEATSLVNSSNRDEISMNTALAKVNEAIRLNPDNENAKLLKDRIQTSIGGKVSVVLSAESEKLYQQAVQELQKGNTIQASALVAQLLQRKENQRSTKILDLKKKVDLLL